MKAEKAELKPFNKSDDQFRYYTDRSLEIAVDEGRITQGDADLIRRFAQHEKVNNRFSEARRYKIVNSLTSISRFFKTPFSENTIEDVYDGFDKLDSGTVLRRNRNGIIDTGRSLKQNVRKDYMMFMIRFYKWMINEGISSISKEKLSSIKLPKQQWLTKSAEEMLTEEEIDRMRDACLNSRDRAILMTLYESACRIHEIAGLRWGDLKFEDDFVILNTRGKTDKPRYIPLHLSRPYIIQWKNDTHYETLPESPVFVSARGGSLTYGSVKKQLENIAKRAGVTKRITPHLFRHSRITLMIKQGYQESIIKKIGWGNEATTMFKCYSHLSDQDILNEVARQNGILPPDRCDKKLSPVQCLKCHTFNAPGFKFCSLCGNPLSKEVVMELEEMREEIHADPVYQTELSALEKRIQALESF